MTASTVGAVRTSAAGEAVGVAKPGALGVPSGAGSTTAAALGSAAPSPLLSTATISRTGTAATSSTPPTAEARRPRRLLSRPWKTCGGDDLTLDAVERGAVRAVGVARRGDRGGVGGADAGQAFELVLAGEVEIERLRALWLRGRRHSHSRTCWLAGL